MPLTPHLQKACVKVLIHCRECKDRLTLEPLFGIVPLTNYPNALPLQARSQVDLIESLIHNLATYSGKRGEPLLDLLVVLRDKREEVEDEWQTLDELFKQVSFYLSSSTVESDESTGERRPGKSETQELRKAVDVYTGKPNQDHNSETAANWIGQSYDNHDEWAFKIALTVFNGGPWDMCMESSVDLANRLAKSSDSKTPITPDLSSTTRPSPLKILEQAGGELVTENARRIVRLKNSQMSREALDYVWDEYTRRELVIDWLSELVTSPNTYKRIRGAIAAGFLMLNNFEGIQRSLLLRWAHADDARSYRQAIGRALSVVAEEGSRLTEVRRLLEYWTTSPDKELRWAAARAYIYVGLRCSIKDVIKHWRSIAEAEDFSSATINFGNIQWVLVNPLHLSLLDAMERLFLNALETPEIRQTAFAEGVESFKQWSDDEQLDDETAEEDGPKSITVGFGLMMLIKLSQMNLPTEDDSRDWPPMLLTLMEPDKTDSVYRRCLVEVFEQLLLDPASQPTALEILREWLNRVERSKRLEAEFRCFIDELLARAPLQGEILRRVATHLDLWSPHSRFRRCPSRPELNGLKHIVLVVDGSESALRYWSEVRSLALELGSALSGTVTPEIYLLNNGEVKDLMALADTKLDWNHEEKPNCSLIAPAMRDLISRRQHSDALILIGNGEVFDLEDWLGHPSVDRWILVRLGPDGILPERLKNRDEITEDSAATVVYERLLRPIQNKKPYTNGTRATSPASDRWKVDRTGYPMVRIDPLQRYVQLFPVAKVQFEQFISDRSHSSWTDEDYAEALTLNPRVSFRETSCTRFERLFVTGIRPSETTDFCKWLGDGFSLPNDRQWLTSYNWLAGQAITDPPPGLSEDALAIWRIIVAVRKPKTLLDLSLMPEGIREWVTVGSDVDRFSALGSPVHRFPTLSRDARTLVRLTTVEPRLNAYGFRLLRS